MNDVLKKKALNTAVTLMEIYAPMVAGKAEPGQFIILRADENGERIPLTIADSDRKKGSITIIFQIAGATTEVLNHINEGGCIHDLAGPLGKATETSGLKKVAVVGGGAGCAIAYPIVKKLFGQGCEVDVIAGFRSRNLVILEEELKKTCSRFTLVTDDGSSGAKGFVTDALKTLLERGEKYERIFAIGPFIMMKAVCKLTKAYGIKTPAQRAQGRRCRFRAFRTDLRRRSGEKGLCRNGIRSAASCRRRIGLRYTRVPSA